MIYETAELLHGVIGYQTYINVHGTDSYEYYGINANVADLCDETLPEEAKFVADYIIDTLRYKSHRAFMDFAYSTEAFKAILAEENLGGKVYGRLIDMSKDNRIFRPSKKDLKSARKRVIQAKDRGSDYDYYAHMSEEYRKSEATRRGRILAAFDNV